MTGFHLDTEMILKLRCCALAPREEERCLDHLVECSSCRSLVDETCGPPLGADERLATSEQPVQLPPQIPPAAYGNVVDRVLESVLDEGGELQVQRGDLSRLVSDLNGMTPAQKKLVVRNTPRYHRWAVVEHLLDECQRGWSNDPQRSEQAAELALEVADYLEMEGFRGRLLQDLKAEAWSYIGNCRRIRSDLFSAEEAFRSAWSTLEGGSGDILTRARMLDLESSLRRAQRDFDASEYLLSEAITCYQQLGDRHLEGRAFFKLATSLGIQGKHEAAVTTLERSAELLDYEREPVLLFLLKQNQMRALTELDRLEEARALLPEVRNLAKSHGTRLEQLRFRWSEGVLFARLGQAEIADQVLQQVRQGYIRAGIGYNLALVSLDLAGLYLEAGRTAEVRALARETYLLFASRSIHREALAAWALFRRAAERDEVSLRLLDEVAARIHRVKNVIVETDDPL